MDPLSYTAREIRLQRKVRGPWPAVFAWTLAGGAATLLHAIPPEELRIEKFSGDEQRGVAGTALPRPLLVRVYESAYDRPPAGNVSVRFEVIAGSARIVAASDLVRSDPHGVAGVAVLLGDMEGADEKWTPTGGREPVIVRASLVCDPTRQVLFHLEKERATLRVARIWDAAAATALHESPPRVRIGDPYVVVVEAVPDRDVRIWASSGKADLIPAHELWTGESGRHRFVFIPGALGQLSLALALREDNYTHPESCISFRVVPRPDPGAGGLRLDVVSGDRQYGADSRDLARPIELRLTRGADQPVAGATVACESFEGRARIECTGGVSDEHGRIFVRYVCPRDMDRTDAVRVVAVHRSANGVEETASAAFVVQAPTVEFVEEKRPGGGVFESCRGLSVAVRLHEEDGPRRPWPDHRPFVEVRCRDLGPTVRVELEARDPAGKKVTVPSDLPMPAVRGLELREAGRTETHVIYRSGPLLGLHRHFPFASLTAEERAELEQSLRLFGRDVFLCGDSTFVHGPLPDEEGR